MTLSERLLKLIEAINRSGYDFLIDMFANSQSKFSQKAYEVMKTHEKNAMYLFDTPSGLNNSGIMWYLSAWYLVFMYKCIHNVYATSVSFKNDPLFKEELADVPLHKVLFSIPREEIEGDPELEFFVDYNGEFQAVYKKFVGRYKMFFGKDLILEEVGAVNAFFNTMKDFKKSFNEYFGKIEHYKNFEYRLIDMFEYMKDGRPMPIDKVLEGLSGLEERYNARKREPLDERVEVKYWKDKGVNIDTEFMVFSGKPTTKWIYKPVQICPYERDFGKNCGNNSLSHTHSNHFFSLRRKAEKDDVRKDVGPNDWDVIATCDYNPNNGLMAGCKGVGFNVNRSSGSSYSTANGNLKPGKDLHKYYMRLWALPIIRGFYSDNMSGHAPQENLRPRDLSESEMEELEAMILDSFKKAKKVDKYKYINFFGEKKALENKIVKSQEEISKVMSKESSNASRRDDDEDED